MLFCVHCGYKLDENKVEKKASTLSSIGDTKVKEGVKVNYVCPKCGHLIHDEISEEEVKTLSQASHAQMQRSRNAIASGMGRISIGAIALVIAVLFFFLAKKPAEGHRLVTTCPEFFVSMALFAVAAILFIAGAVRLAIGISKKITYGRLLKDINNRTFVQ